MAASDINIANVVESIENGTQCEVISHSIEPSTTNLTSCENAPCLENDNDDTLDVDLSAINVESSIIDSSFQTENPVLFMAENIDEPYRNILSMCSSNAQNIKKSISDVLSARQSVVITEVDNTAELQESLNQKIADFTKVVNSSSSTSIAQTSEDRQKDKSSSRESTPVNEEKRRNISDSVKLRQKTNSLVSNISDDKKDSTKISAQDSKSLQVQQIQDAVKVISLADEDKSQKKQKNGASKKKGEKNMDQIMKSLGSGTTEEKLQLLGKKHVEILEEQRMMEPRLRQLERQNVSLQREKEVLQADHNRMILAKSRLESLCREMQRQNKAIKEENLLRIKEEEEKRKEVANKFQSTLNDISTLMQENSKKNMQLREENAEYATKLKSLVDNYEVWEQNMSQVVQKKELEAQLAKAKHAKVNLLLKQETEKFLREKQSLLENLSVLQKKCTMLATNELQLRTELSDYTSKYEEFQNVLSNSSKVFASFKSDMDATTKKIKKLEKETNSYKQKWESSNNALLDMVAHKEKQDKEITVAQQRIQTLEKLCRALQAERNEIKQKLNALTMNCNSGSEEKAVSVPAETEAI